MSGFGQSACSSHSIVKHVLPASYNTPSPFLNSSCQNHRYITSFIFAQQNLPETAIHPNNRLRPFCHFDEVVLVTSSDKACYRGQHLSTWFVQAGLAVFCIDSSASTSLVKSCAFSTLCIVLYVTTLCISLSEEMKEF